MDEDLGDGGMTADGVLDSDWPDLLASGVDHISDAPVQPQDPALDRPGVACRESAVGRLRVRPSL